MCGAEENSDVRRILLFYTEHNLFTYKYICSHFDDHLTVNGIRAGSQHKMCVCAFIASNLLNLSKFTKPMIHSSSTNLQKRFGVWGIWI